MAVYCDNPSCPAQLKRTLLHFSSRAAMDIQGLGEAAVDQLADSGHVKDMADIYKLTKGDLLKLELFADKRAGNLLERIEESKSRPLAKTIYGLGIRHVGEKTAETLAERYSLDDLAEAGASELEKVLELGPVVAASIANFFARPKARDLIARLRRAGLNFRKAKTRAGSSPLACKTVVFTGELASMTRQKAEERVKDLGAKTSSSVSAKTSYVVAGEAAGSKLSKARALGVRILSEQEFLKLTR